MGIVQIECIDLLQWCGIVVYIIVVWCIFEICNCGVCGCAEVFNGVVIGYGWVTC